MNIQLFLFVSFSYLNPISIIMIDVRTQDVPACVLQITLKHVSQNAWVATPFRSFSKPHPTCFWLDHVY